MAPKRSDFRWGILLVLSLVTVFIWQGVLRAERAVLTVAFLDVGQGDAVFIEGPTGIQLLVDGGATGAVLRELSHMIPFYDRSLDVVVATHPDQDHIGGIPDVLAHYEVDVLVRSGAQNDTAAFRELNSWGASGDIEQIIALRGMIIELGEGAYAEVLFPDRDVRGVDPNSASIVLRVVYGETEFLLTGDAPQNIERYLVTQDGDGLQSDVLKVGHHGSKTSSSELFVGVASPQYAVISAGKDNRYGHPHSEVLDVFRQFEIPILGTYEEGTIVFESDGFLLRVVE